jgi:hypothetical protein
VLGASGAAAFAASLLHDPLPHPAGPRLRSAVDAKLFSSPTPADLALNLVTDSTGKGPGTALADNATAIQTAVNTEQTATACADITD